MTMTLKPQYSTSPNLEIGSQTLRSTCCLPRCRACDKVAQGGALGIKQLTNLSVLDQGSGNAGLSCLIAGMNEEGTSQKKHANTCMSHMSHAN